MLYTRRYWKTIKNKNNSKKLNSLSRLPNNISNSEILSKKEYFGQFETIIKIMISSKEDEKLIKKITHHI